MSLVTRSFVLNLRKRNYMTSSQIEKSNPFDKQPWENKRWNEKRSLSTSRQSVIIRRKPRFDPARPARRARSVPSRIWQTRFIPARSPYGERGSSCPARHMVSLTIRQVPLAVWRAQLHLSNTSHSRLVFVSFSFELRSYCISFRLDYSYRWNFTIKTAKTCFSRISSNWS